MSSDFAYRHDSPEQLGVLLVNLGTPDSPSRADVRRYLREFLWDPRVVEMARPIWWLVLNLIILNTRPSRSAKAYEKVWTEQGSPLMVISQQQRDALDKALANDGGVPVQVELAMRYGNPSIEHALKALRAAGVQKLLVLPLYPQYSATTVASVFDEVSRVLQGWRWLPELRFINRYHDNPAYIAALAESVRGHWGEHGQPDKLVMSFHGIPHDYFLSGDPYHCECHKTGRLLAEALELADDQWQLTFQSRVGPKQWLQPYTDKTLEQLGKEGVKHVQVITPGFAADCLETIEEIGMENRDVFLEAGGAEYSAIACLNTEPAHIDMLAGLVRQHCAGWMNEPPSAQELAGRVERARRLGAET